MTTQIVDVIILKSPNGYLARSPYYGVTAQDESLQKTKEAIREALSEYMNQEDFGLGNIHFTYPLDCFFGKESVLQTKAFANRLGINPGLLAQYIAGVKTPSDKQLKRIEDGIREIGAEFVRLQAVLAAPVKRERITIVDATEPQVARESVLREFLLAYQDECDFTWSDDMDSFFGFRITATGNGTPEPTLTIKMPSDRQERRETFNALREVVETTLGLRYNLEERRTTDWNTGETIYPIHRRRGLAYKQFMIDAFQSLYRANKIETVLTDEALQLVAVSRYDLGETKVTLIVDYHPTRPGEREALQEWANTFSERNAAIER